MSHDRRESTRFDLAMDLQRSEHQIRMIAEHLRYATDRLNAAGLFDVEQLNWRCLKALQDGAEQLAGKVRSARLEIFK